MTLIHLPAILAETELEPFKVKKVGYIGGKNPDTRKFETWNIYEIPDDKLEDLKKTCDEHGVPYKIEVQNENA